MSIQSNNNGNLCAICENNGYIRYNCTNELLIGDLERIIDTSHNTRELTSRVNEINSVLENIKEHNTYNYNNHQMLALLAFLVLQKNYDNNCNMNKHITMEIKEIQESVLENFDCAVCIESVPVINSLTFDCNHSFCGECVITNIKKDKHTKSLQCYLCRHNVKNISIFDDKDTYDKLKEQLEK